MTGLLAAVWFFGTLASIFFVVRPRPDLPPYANRKRSTGMLAAFFLGVPFLSALAGLSGKTPDPSGTPTSSANSPKSTPNQPKTADSPVVPTAWAVTEETSALDDSHNVFAALDADDKIKGWLGSERPTLTLRCKEGKVDVYLDTKAQITSEIDFDSGQQLADVKYRVGKSELVSGHYSLSSDGKAIFFRRPEALIASLGKASTFVVEYTPFQSGLGTATFQLAGADDVASKVLKGCRKT